MSSTPPKKKRSLIAQVVAAIVLVVGILAIAIPIYQRVALNASIEDLRSPDRTTRLDAARRLREIGKRATSPLLDLMVDDHELQLRLQLDEEVMNHLKHILPNEEP